MHSIFALVMVAVMVMSALAAPTPAKSISKRSFTVPIKPRIEKMRSPLQELARTHAKYGWEIIITDPMSAASSSLSNPFPDAFSSSEPSSSAVPLIASTSSVVAFVPASSEAPAPYVWNATSAMTSYAPSTATSISEEVTSMTASATSATTSAAKTAGGETGEVSAVPEENDAEYLEPVKIGTNPQTLNLDFDTGSADFWVFSSSLSSSKSNGHTVFNPADSSTWKDYEGGSWTISYGDGSAASGNVGFDAVNIGGATVTKQAIELATAVSGSFVTDVASDGLVGLAFSNINTVTPKQQRTFFDNVKGQLQSEVFTADLKDNAAGSYTFGEIDSSQYSGEIHYAPVDGSEGFWQFDSNSYSIDGKVSQCTTCSPAIADTGTSLLLLDEDVVAAYYESIGASFNEQQLGYTYDCNKELPSFGMSIGNWTATIPGSKLTYAPIGDGTCFGGIQGNSGEGIQIMGDMLFKNFFAVFDGEQTRFGLANKATSS